jgi:hypothetical protein
VSLSLLLSSFFLLLSFFPLPHWHTRSSCGTSLFLSHPRSFYLLYSTQAVSCPLPFRPFCAQTLPLSFPLSLQTFSLFLSLFLNPEFNLVMMPLASLPFFFSLFAPSPSHWNSFGSDFSIFSSSVPQPMLLPDPLSRIILRSPKILLLFYLIPVFSSIVPPLLLLPSLSFLLPCVLLCASFLVSIFFIHLPTFFLVL